MPQPNRLPEPPSPEQLAVVAMYRACGYLADALLEEGIHDCQENYDWRGLLYALQLLTSSLESSIHGHKAVRQAAEKFLLKMIQLEGYDVVLPRDVITLASMPSSN
jgi:hypothetical protein